MAKQRGLGRGFDSLIPTEVTADMPATVQPPAAASAPADSDALRQLDPATVQPNPHQPRTHFDATELQGLADSIREHGVLQPIVVSDRGDGSYELVAGERRLRASKLAGLKTVPAIIRSFGEQQKLELALIENVQRAELNPMEAASAYRQLANEFHLSLDQIGARVGKAKSTVANSMRLLQLPAAAGAAVASGVISEAHGRAILALTDPAAQEQLLRHITADGWTVRQAEAFARSSQTRDSGSKTATLGAQPPAAAALLAQQLSSYLHTKVSLQQTARGGRLVIGYKDDAELLRIIKEIKPS